MSTPVNPYQAFPLLNLYGASPAVDPDDALPTLPHIHYDDDGITSHTDTWDQMLRTLLEFPRPSDASHLQAQRNGTSGVAGAPAPNEQPPGNFRPRTTSPWVSDGSDGRHVDHVIPHGQGQRTHSYTPRWCERCRFMFPDTQTHAEFHKSVEPIPDAVIQAHLLQLKGGRVACMWECCPATCSFGRFHEARRHIRSQHGPRLYGCQVCGKTFMRDESLVRHMVDQHNE